ncbi:uncharacterized protein LOC129883684 [Solanum dulcamara]|uniref:uncharacterized protein LOC129883684 n=1 Tax=Solanum dulcamara TaxID=45834 RepID=UPI002485F03B|nr:uncharacterized protein LOC129883684 [Solanum dulcamara]
MVTFPKLPLNCWGVSSLSRIASAIGVPLFADECTTKQTRISYARMLIEVNVTKPIPHQITVMDPNGKTFSQTVELEWRPQYCDKCQKIGHQCHNTTLPKDDPIKRRRPGKKVTETWQYKGVIQPQGHHVEGNEEQQQGIVRSSQHNADERFGQQVKGTISPRNTAGWAATEFNLTNFPVMATIATKNGGVNKRYKQKELKNYLHNNKINLAGLIETRVKEHNMKTIVKGIAPEWGILTNYNAATNGRIWLIWDENCTEKIFGRTQVLSSLAQGITLPWLIAGDFNALLSPQDRQAGSTVSLSEVKEFVECVQNIGVAELPWRGSYYSWSNKQHESDRISSRIARTFGNYEWMLIWGHVITDYGNPGISDHCPMLITLQEPQASSRVNFKLFNVWAEHESFLPMVESTWRRNYSRDRMKNVWIKLKQLQHKLKGLNNSKFKFISQKIDKAREELKGVQEQPTIHVTDELIDQEKEILMKLEKWSMIEESALKKKSRTKWIQLGDANNKYFSAVIKERTQKKQIRNITSLAEERLHDPTDIQNEFVQFYKGLTGSSTPNLPAIDIQIMKRGAVLSRQQRIDLCADISEEEIYI